MKRKYKRKKDLKRVLKKWVPNALEQHLRMSGYHEEDAVEMVNAFVENNGSSLLSVLKTFDNDGCGHDYSWELSENIKEFYKGRQLYKDNKNYEKK